MHESENKIKTKIESFFNLIKNDENHRYKSWEHCYSYFSKPKEEIEIDKACLHLAFYLASWGMYRGSTFLFWKDYLIHKGVVELLLQNKHFQNIDFREETKVDDIFSLINDIKDSYKNNISLVNGKSKIINVSDTLATKILLGTLGCIPAYDRYFLRGLKENNITPNSFLSKSNFEGLVKLYRSNQIEFDRINLMIKAPSEIKYTTMKLIDMYMWQIGFEEEEKDAIKRIKKII